MTIEEIEAEARMYSSIQVGGPRHLEDFFEREKFEAGFIAGAEWRVNSVWHDWEDGNNVPDVGKLCLVEFETDVDSKYYQRLVHADKFKGHDVTGVPYFWNTPKKAHILRWVYVDDLLPNKEE